MQFRQWVRKNGLLLTGYVLAALIAINALLLFFFRSEMQKAQNISRVLDRVQTKTEELRTNASRTDIALRNYSAVQAPPILQEYESALNALVISFDTLDYVLKRENYPLTLHKINSAIASHENYLSAIHDGNIAEQAQTNALPVLVSTADGFLTALERNHQSQLDRVNAGALFKVVTVLQIFLLAGIPLLILSSYLLTKHRAKLRSLNHEIEESNRTYVFNDHQEVDYENDELIKTRLLTNLRKATDFIQNISKGNYDIQWEGMDEKNAALNRENIAGELLRMRDQMKQVKEDDRIRIWMTEGLSKFSEIIRKQQDNFEVLLDTLISSVVKYVNAQVGGLFIVKETEGEHRQHLQLRACYAFERKKYLTKEIAIGEGLVGQAYLEGQTIFLKRVPDQYVSITSGLGDTKPHCVLVIPLKTNDKIEGVLELASLREFKAHDIEFLEKLGETLASTIVSVRAGEKTKALLEISQSQTEQMRAQEEEMRQNMEELEATQEQMARQMEEMRVLKQNLEKEQYLFGALMDNIPDAIYFKDRDCKLIRVSKHMVTTFGGREDQLIGKSDFDFQDEAHAREAYEDEQTIMRTRKPKIDYIEKETREDGTEVWVSTTKMPLVNLQGEVVGTFGISRDVSKLKRLEQAVVNKDQRLQEEEKEYEEKIQMLTQLLKQKDEELNRRA